MRCAQCLHPPRTVAVVTSPDTGLTAPCLARVNDEVDDAVEVYCGAVDDQVVVVGSSGWRL
jgi:hypothetical protein